MIDFGLGVKLERLTNNGSDRALLWRNDPKIWRWTRQNDLISEDRQAQWFKNQNEDVALNMYAIISGDGYVGVCGLTSIHHTNRNAEFSLYIAPEFHRRGFSKKALKTLFYHGFKNMNLHQIWGETLEGNHALKIFTDIGMMKDGRRRQFYWKDGKYHDAVMISILRDEFIEKHGDKSCFS